MFKEDEEGKEKKKKELYVFVDENFDFVGGVDFEGGVDNVLQLVQFVDIGLYDDGFCVVGFDFSGNFVGMFFVCWGDIGQDDVGFMFFQQYGDGSIKIVGGCQFFEIIMFG